MRIHGSMWKTRAASTHLTRVIGLGFGLGRLGRCGAVLFVLLLRVYACVTMQCIGLGGSSILGCVPPRIDQRP
mgnify:CR=1 FL=1